MAEPSSGFDLQPSADAKSTRVDSAHGHAEDSNGLVSCDDLATIAGVNGQTNAQQLERQTAEISGLLTPAGQGDMDWREAELHARLAQLENELRAARLRARQSSAERERKCRQPTPMDCKGVAAEPEADFQAAQEENDPLPGFQLGDESWAVADIEDFDQIELLAVEATGNASEPQLERPIPIEERGPVDPGSLRREAEDELHRNRQLLKHRKQELDRRRAAVEKMYDETQAMHRETLEMRLVTEQLWADLSKTAAPAALTKSVSHLRASLAEQYRKHYLSLSLRQAQLKDLKDQLSRKQQMLRCRSKRLQRWIDERHLEIEKQALRLVARENELTGKEKAMDAEFNRWARQKKQYQQQIQELMRQLGHSTSVCIDEDGG